MHPHPHILGTPTLLTYFVKIPHSTHIIERILYILVDYSCIIYCLIILIQNWFRTTKAKLRLDGVLAALLERIQIHYHEQVIHNIADVEDILHRNYRYEISNKIKALMKFKFTVTTESRKWYKRLYLRYIILLYL